MSLPISDEIDGDNRYCENCMTSSYEKWVNPFTFLCNACANEEFSDKEFEDEG